MSKNYYTGIGSRETPDVTLIVMSYIAAEFATQGWVLRSGGAEGADTAFENGCDMSKGEKEIYLPWKGFNHNRSALHPETFPFQDYEEEFASRIHPAWDKCSPSAKKMMIRNGRQIIGCEALHGEKVLASRVVICWTQRGKLLGGTAQAIRIAHYAGIPVINLGAANNENELKKMIESIGDYFK